MKSAIFSDFHHHPQRFMRGNYKELDTIFVASAYTNVNFIMLAGTQIPHSSIV